MSSEPLHATGRVCLLLLIAQHQTPIHISQLKNQLAEKPEAVPFMSTKHNYINIQIAFLKKHGYLATPAHGLYTLAQKGRDAIADFWKILEIPAQPINGDSQPQDLITQPHPQPGFQSQIQRQPQPEPQAQAQLQPSPHPTPVNSTKSTKAKPAPKKKTATPSSEFNPADLAETHADDIFEVLQSEGIQTAKPKVLKALGQLITDWGQQNPQGDKKCPLGCEEELLKGIGWDVLIVENTSKTALRDALLVVWADFLLQLP